MAKPIHDAQRQFITESSFIFQRILQCAVCFALKGPPAGELPEAPPVAEEAIEVSEKTGSNVAAPRRQGDHVFEGHNLTTSCAYER